MASRKQSTSAFASNDFESLVVTIAQIHHQAQAFATKAVNVGLTLRNWLIGHRVVEFEQNGDDRAAYGERLLPELANRLVAAGLKRVDARELRRFRLLYSVYPQIRESLTPELLALKPRRSSNLPSSYHSAPLWGFGSVGSRRECCVAGAGHQSQPEGAGL